MKRTILSIAIALSTLTHTVFAYEGGMAVLPVNSVTTTRDQITITGEGANSFMKVLPGEKNNEDSKYGDYNKALMFTTGNNTAMMIACTRGLLKSPEDRASGKPAIVKPIEPTCSISYVNSGPESSVAELAGKAFPFNPYAIAKKILGIK
jgi:hypothetical protein